LNLNEGLKIFDRDEWWNENFVQSRLRQAEVDYSVISC